ncbi:hypothetical protein BH09PSE6_BH09PSE6_13070 [soil metagenome]
MKTCLMVASLVTALAATTGASAQTNPFNKDAAPAGPADQSKALPDNSRLNIGKAGNPVANDLGPDIYQRKNPSNASPLQKLQKPVDDGSLRSKK